MKYGILLSLYEWWPNKLITAIHDMADCDGFQNFTLFKYMSGQKYILKKLAKV